MAFWLKIVIFLLFETSQIFFRDGIGRYGLVVECATADETQETLFDYTTTVIQNGIYT